MWYGLFLIFLYELIQVYNIIADLDFTFLEMNPFTLVNGNPYPLDMRGELDDTAAFKNFKKYAFSLFFVCNLFATSA